MDVSIKCISCGQILGFGAMTKQSVKQSAKQAFNWKVMLGLKKLNGSLPVKVVVRKGKQIFVVLNVKAKKFGLKTF